MWRPSLWQVEEGFFQKIQDVVRRYDERCGGSKEGTAFLGSFDEASELRKNAARGSKAQRRQARPTGKEHDHSVRHGSGTPQAPHELQHGWFKRRESQKGVVRRLHGVMLTMKMEELTNERRKEGREETKRIKNQRNTGFGRQVQRKTCGRGLCWRPAKHRKNEQGRGGEGEGGGEYRTRGREARKNRRCQRATE